MHGGDIAELIAKLRQIKRDRVLPEPAVLGKQLRGATDVLNSEDPALRPRDFRRLPGGLVFLREVDYYVIVPDLHARMNFFYKILTWKGPLGNLLVRDLAEDRAQVICVGDAFHSERRGIRRWRKAFEEFSGGFLQHRFMDEEMAENLGLLEMIARVKQAFPLNFHFLKGNHENIANERGEGNYPFMKFVMEGEMVLTWMKAFMGDSLFRQVYVWEKALPLMAAGKDFLVTHCEPGRSLEIDEVINAYQNPDVIYNLTWVGNDEAHPGSVSGTLSNIISAGKRGRIFGGHRPVADKYDLRQDGSYVQINTPDKHVIAVFHSMEDFDPRGSIIEI